MGTRGGETQDTENTGLTTTVDFMLTYMGVVVTSHKKRLQMSLYKLIMFMCHP